MEKGGKTNPQITRTDLLKSAEQMADGDAGSMRKAFCWSLQWKGNCSLQGLKQLPIVMYCSMNKVTVVLMEGGGTGPISLGLSQSLLTSQARASVIR